MACRVTKIMFDVDLFCLKPYCDSCMRSPETSLINLLSRILASSFPVTEKRDISAVSALHSISHMFVDQYYDGVFPVLGYSFSFPVSQNKVVKFPHETLTSVIELLTRKSIAPGDLPFLRMHSSSSVNDG